MKVRFENIKVFTKLVQSNEIYLIKKQLAEHRIPHYCLFIKVGENCIYISDDGRLSWDRNVDALIKNGEIVILEKVTDRVEVIVHNEDIGQNY